MADINQKRLGRTLHAIQLLSYYQLMPISPGGTNFPGMIAGSAQEQGFIAARETFFKDTIRTIFRLDVTTNTYHVGDRWFSVNSMHGNINVPGGIVSKISLASFPYQTTLTIWNRNGTIAQQIPMAGNIAL